ncbi:MAG: DUF488 domain-containing protein [Thermoproteota archaeon]|nr:DUF488 domain-containing protein [Thermoproteota archaeon]
MKTQSFKEGIDEILLVAKHNAVAAMCAEALPWRCYRGVISDYLTMFGLGVGNNSKILANNTNIGNPNAGKAASAQEKITSGTPTNGLSSNPTKGSQKTPAAAGSSGQNKTGGTSNMSNMTGGTGKSSVTANSTKK